MKQIKGKVLLSLLLVLLISVLVACGGEEAGTENNSNSGNTSNSDTASSEDASSEEKEIDMPDSLEIPSGSVGGGFYNVASLLGKVLEEEFSIPASAAPTGGSVENLNLMLQGSAHISMVAANTAGPAWYGTGAFEGKPNKEFSLVTKLYDNPTVFVALKSSGITSVSDLAGKRIGAGSAKGTWDPITRPFIEAHGIDYDNNLDTVYGGFNDLFTQVSDGVLDATVGTSNMTAITQIASQKEVNYLKWDPEAMDKLEAEIPYYSRTTVSSDLLPGLDGPTYETIDMGGPYLLARNDLSEEFVYELTKRIHENLSRMGEELVEMEPLAVDDSRMASPIGEIPFHPGAVKYYKEIGFIK